MLTKKIEIVSTIGAFAGFFVLWELVSRSGFFNINLFPPPSIVLSAFLESVVSGEYLQDVTASLVRVLAGLFIGSLLGITLGILTGRINAIRLTFGQIINFLKNIPSIAFVPLALVWFGISEISQIFLVVWGVIFPVWVNTYQGMAQVDKHYLWAIKSLGATRIQTLKEVILPNVMPFVVAGLRIGIAMAFITLVAAEMAGTFSGVGYRISYSHLIFRVDKMILGIVTLGALGLLSDRIYLLVVRKLYPWIEIK